MTTDIAVGPDGIDPRLALDHAEVTDICTLLEQAAALLTHAVPDGSDDGGECCHQAFQTGHWRDSVLVAGWLTDLAKQLNERSHAALDADLADQPIVAPAEATGASTSTEGRF